MWDHLYQSKGFDFSPLPYSKKEIMAIARYFKKRDKSIFLGDSAKEETLKNAFLKDYQIVHFACHCFLDEEFPHRSALVLSFDKNREDDGFLHVHEIYNLMLNADLVVLSACQTGKGSLEKGEGLLGLPRIFFYSGARSVLSSLWEINDQSTSVFMAEFYRFLADRNNLSEALRLAKIRMMKSKYSHPFYWSAFVLNGNFKSVLNLH
jgi:CHAT domain-containing protein